MSEQTRRARITYIADGNQKTFVFPFDYLKRSFITVYVDSVALLFGVDYQVENNQVTLETTPPQNSILHIIRNTSTDRLVTWEDASILRSKDMTIQEMQIRHSIEEIRDLVQEGNLALNDENNWDALFLRIVNVADPITDRDVVTLGYLNSIKAGIITERQKAEQAALQAKTSETNSKVSEEASASSASGSHRKASEAAQSATDARTSRDAAQLYASDAENSKLNAEVAEGNAEDAARRALEYKQATESFKNQAKQSAESVGAVVQEATDQADRAEREANRSESEADRAERAAREAEGIAGGGVTSLNGVHGAITLQAVGATLSQEDNTLTITVDIPEVESPVASVNDKKGAVTISLDDLGGAKKIHPHDIDNIANLATLLDSLHDLIEGKANKNHTHSIEQIANLATALGDLQDAIDVARFSHWDGTEDEFDALVKTPNTYYFVEE